MKKFLVLIVVFASLNAQAKEKLPSTYSEIAKQLFIEQKDSIYFKNVFFKNDLPEKGKESFESDYQGDPTEIYGGFSTYLKKNGIESNNEGYYEVNSKEIVFEDCEFEDDLRFFKMFFKGDFMIANCAFPKTSGDYVGSHGQKFGGAVIVDSCKFENSFELIDQAERSYRFFFKSLNTIYNYFGLGLQKSTSQIKKSGLNNVHIQIHKDESKFWIEVSQIYNLDYFEVENIRNLIFRDNTFKDTSNELKIFWLYSDNIDFIGNIFDSNVMIHFDKSTVQLVENKFNKKLALDFNEINSDSYIDMKSLKDLNFGLGENFHGEIEIEDNECNGDFKRYLRVHKKLYDHFRTAGDLDYANKSYVKMKDLENKRYKADLAKYPTFKNWFNLMLNQLLKRYTNYSTEPAKALVVSFNIILLFAVFYFFFPSDWDGKSKGQLFKHYKDFAEKNDKGYFLPFLKLLGGLLISFLNAISLSLNAFTTLGFGKIPTKGIARNVCIIQGFIGWFLLSLFTVALINQIQL